MGYAYLGWHHAIAHGILTDSFMCILLYITHDSRSPFYVSNGYATLLSDYPITIQL